MKKLSWLIAAITVAASAAYIFVYLYRWEWHRALLVGVLFIGSEVALVTAILLRQIRGMRLPASEQEQRLAHRLQEQRPAGKDHFEWLASSDRAGVFLPILLGGGVIISALAWLVEKIAGNARDAFAGEVIVQDMVVVSFPQEPLVPAEDVIALSDDEAGDEVIADFRLLLGPRASR